MQRITPFLWFEDKAEEAINFYTSVFSGAPGGSGKIINITKYPENAEGPMKGFAGKVLNGIFELNGMRFMALDGGPVFKFGGAISFIVDCQNQEEVDYYWEKLSADPSSEQCGWLKDKYGMGWQIIPKQLGELMSDPDKEKVARVTHAMLQMKKLDIAKLEEAAKTA